MATGKRFFMEPLRSLAFGAIGAAYVRIGTPIDSAARSFLVQNLTNATMIFSFGNDIDNFVLPAYGQFVYDSSANRTNRKDNLLPNNLSLYVKQETAAPTTGTVYFSIFAGDKDSI